MTVHVYTSLVGQTKFKTYLTRRDFVVVALILYCKNIQVEIICFSTIFIGVDSNLFSRCQCYHSTTIKFPPFFDFLSKVISPCCLYHSLKMMLYTYALCINQKNIYIQTFANALGGDLCYNQTFNLRRNTCVEH